MRGKERSFLKKLAHGQRALSQVGKDGITDSYIESLDKLLEDHELIKISFLDSFAEDLDKATEEILERSDSEFIQKIGRKLVIYRQSRTNPMIEIPGADNRRVIANRQRIEAKKKQK